MFLYRENPKKVARGPASRGPFAADDAVVFCGAEAAAVADVGALAVRADPFAADAAVVFFAAEAVVAAEARGDAGGALPLAALGAVVFFAAEAAVAAEHRRVVLGVRDRREEGHAGGDGDQGGQELSTRNRLGHDNLRSERTTFRAKSSPCASCRSSRRRPRSSARSARATSWWAARTSATFRRG